MHCLNSLTTFDGADIFLLFRYGLAGMINFDVGLDVGDGSLDVGDDSVDEDDGVLIDESKRD